MSEQVPRRRLIQGAAVAAAVVAFDPVAMAWAAEGTDTAGLDLVPPLDGSLTVEPASREEAADDYGHIVHRLPRAVLRPGSERDVVTMVRFCRARGLKVAMRGQGHTCYGQAQVGAGIVIDSRTMAAVHAVYPTRAEVGPGATWADVLAATAPLGLTPPVLTDYLGLSVGGTLSTGGIGGASQHHGVQADTVYELRVVTGRGELVRCSPQHNRDLFDAVLAGLGQYGIIVRATIGLVPAPAMARVFTLLYDDLGTYLADQLTLLGDGRFSYLEGQVQPRPDGAGWRYLIEAVSYHTPPTVPDDAALLAGLSDDRAQATISTTTYVGWAHRLDPAVEFLKAIGDWYRPHPMLDLFVPASRASAVVSDALATLTPLDIGIGPILLYPVDTRRFTRPLFRVPREPDGFLFSLLRTTAGADPALLRRQLDSNRALYEANLAAGGTWYPIGAIEGYDRDDWRRHYGPLWPDVLARKDRYDPDHVLAPGQNMF
jgi:cytokinin dehydrogenase